MSQFLKNDLLERLDRLDEDADLLFDGEEKRFRMVIVGGSALVLLETITRATHDIDALEAPPEILSLLERYDINTQVSAYMNNFPYNYDDRLVPIHVGGRRIDFYTASLEDVVIAKLCSARSKDRQDIISPSVLAEIDWERLEHLATADDEIKLTALNERSYNEFLYNYHEYVERYRR